MRSMHECVHFLCSIKNFKSLFNMGIVLAIEVSNLHILSNENDWCHSTWVTSLGNIKACINPSRPLFASSLASSRTDHLFPLSPQSSPLSIMRRTHPIYRPLVSGKSFFLSKPMDPQRNNFDIFNSCFDFSILIPILMTASQLLLWLQHFNSCPNESILIPALSFTTLFFFLWLIAQGFLLSQAVNKTSKNKTINIFINFLLI